MEQVPLFVWDFDGVIIHMLDYTLHVYNTVLTKHGMPRPLITMKELKQASYPNPKVIAQNLGMTSKELLNNIDVEWRRGTLTDEPLIKLTPGIDKLLEEYSENYPQVILTGASKERTTYSVKRFGLGKYFQSIITREDIGFPKTDENCYNIARKIVGVDFKDWIYVEDMSQNIPVTNGLGILTTALTCGYGTPEKIYATNPYAMVGNTRDLKTILDSVLKSKYGKLLR